MPRLGSATFAGSMSIMGLSRDCHGDRHRSRISIICCCPSHGCRFVVHNELLRVPVPGKGPGGEVKRARGSSARGVRRAQAF